MQEPTWKIDEKEFLVNTDIQIQSSTLEHKKQTHIIRILSLLLLFLVASNAWNSSRIYKHNKICLNFYLSLKEICMYKHNESFSRLFDYLFSYLILFQCHKINYMNVISYDIFFKYKVLSFLVSFVLCWYEETLLYNVQLCNANTDVTQAEDKNVRNS